MFRGLVEFSADRMIFTITSPHALSYIVILLQYNEQRRERGIKAKDDYLLSDVFYYTS